MLLNGRRCRCGFLQAAQIEIRGASLFGLVVVGAWDTEGDTVLARLLGVIGVLAGAAHLAGTARIAALGLSLSLDLAVFGRDILGRGIARRGRGRVGL